MEQVVIWILFSRGEGLWFKWDFWLLFLSQHILCRSTNDGLCKGADANRNWGYRFDTGGSSDSACSDTYHGKEAFSEVENQVDTFLSCMSESGGRFFKQKSSGIAKTDHISLAAQDCKQKFPTFLCTLAFMTCLCNSRTSFFKELASDSGHQYHW